MLHRIRTASGRTLTAIAAAVLLAGTATAAAASAAPGSRVEVASTQTNYMYFADATYEEIVGHATEGCGDPWTLQWGVVTAYVRTVELECPT